MTKTYTLIRIWHQYDTDMKLGPAEKNITSKNSNNKLNVEKVDDIFIVITGFEVLWKVELVEYLIVYFSPHLVIFKLSKNLVGLLLG